MTCRRCGAEIVERFVGATRIIVHVNRSIDHPALPPRKPLVGWTEAEKREAYGK